MSNNEELLTALINGETADIKPCSRAEAYLKACCNCEGAEGLPKPISRNDKLLIELADKLHSGGGGGGSYTNLLKTQEVLLNTRIASSTSEPATANSYLTIKNIPITNGDINIRFRGLRKKDDGYLILSNTADEYQNFIYEPLMSVDTNGDTMMSTTNDGYSYCNVTLFLFSDAETITADDIKNCIVTLNEPIT